MSEPVHQGDVGIEAIYVAKGVGVPAMERIAAAAAAVLAAAWGTASPEILDPVAAVELAGHGRRGGHLVPNRKRRYFEVWACAPVRAVAMAELCAAARHLGYRVVPGSNPATGTGYLTITT